MLRPGDRAPSFSLPDIDTAEPVEEPWSGGPAVLVFFKVSCPVCQMVTPQVTALAEGGARVVAVGQDPPKALARYARERGQRVRTVSESAPYPVSAGFAVESVPSAFLVDADGTVRDAVGGWDRDRWNALAVAAGGRPVSVEGDGLPVFRPG